MEKKIPQNSVDKASGSSVISPADFAKLMLMNKQSGGLNKSKNHKWIKKENIEQKASIRRTDKCNIQAAKSYAIKYKKHMEQEAIEWAPADKEDERFAKRMAAKI